MLLLWAVMASVAHAQDAPADSLSQPYEPSRQPTYRAPYRFGDPFSGAPGRRSPLAPPDPSALEQTEEVDTALNYILREEINGLPFRPPIRMSFDQYRQYRQLQQLKEGWKATGEGLEAESAVGGRRLIPPIYTTRAFDRIFGGSYVDIQPTGQIVLDFGANWQRVNNPAIPVREQRNGGFEFNNQINLNVNGQVGDKLNINFNYDNNNTFDFQNQLRIEYTGYEEEILQKIELGNVSMPTQNSLITGAQSLFGVKTQMRFGKLYVTSVASVQNGTSQSISLENGSQRTEFEVRGSDYEENTHFFLGHFFRENYELWLNNLPQVNSGITITRVEVYVLNRNNNTETQRNFVGFMDLGEGSRLVDPTNPNIAPLSPGPTRNSANALWDNITADDQLRTVAQAADRLESVYGFERSRDFEAVSNARQLSPTEFTFMSELGIVSLNRPLQNDEMLGVSFEYTYRGQSYRVGELTEQYQNRSEDQAIFLKLLRPGRIATDLPSWDLMMKNIYSLNASRITEDGFQLRVIYRDDASGVDNPSLHLGENTKDVPLVALLGLDQLNLNGDRVPEGDGNFDYIPGLTIFPERGTIMFPVLEPFGDHLASQFNPVTEQSLIERFVYDTLYATTQIDASLVSGRNKFFIKGEFVGSSSSSIVLPGINIAEGSVVVRAGSQLLQEGTDYTVDYNLGRVNIINQGVLNSGRQVDISYEQTDLFNFQTRTLLGSHFDYRFSENFNIGATVLYLNERPLVTRIAIGNEPVRNLKYGMNLNYARDSYFLTKLVDAIPMVQTKEMSNVTFNAEIAQLRAGTSNRVDGEGASYIDDFENTTTPFGLGTNPLTWQLASTPQSDVYDFNGGVGAEDLSLGYKRARLAWYVIDNVFYRPGPNRPDNITDDDLDNHYTRAVFPQEVFPQRNLEVVNTNERVFDLAFYPEERGPYNFNPGLTAQGLLSNPRESWGGITRAITSDVDFDRTNIEYIEFWMMDPFVNSPNGVVVDGRRNEPNVTGGKLLLNIGSISEDVIRDNRHGFENGLPPDGGTGSTVDTEWGRVTTDAWLVDAFDNDPAARENQDVGMDGLSNEEEQTFPPYQAFISAVPAAADDPSGDNFQYYLGDALDASNAKILERYKLFNNHENNSPVANNTGEAFVPSGANLPDNEDLNNDNTLGTLEEYYEYEIDLRPGDLEVGEGYVVDQVTNTVNGDEVSWYLFRVPIRQPDRSFGGIEGFKSIRYMRLYLTDWAQPAVLRMAKFQMVGSQWRRYEQDLRGKGLGEVPEQYDPDFTVTVVNVEENSQGNEGSTPYRLPPGIIRDRDNTSIVERQQNEQSIQLCMEDLENNDARAVFKNITLDMVNYGRLKMFFHADSPDGSMNDGDVKGFIRLGTDFDENFYEIAVPLTLTRPRNSTNPDVIWPAENTIDIALNSLYAVKSARDRAQFPISQAYTLQNVEGRFEVTIVGRPELGTVQSLMLGVRNPIDSPNEDGQPKTVCVWANELRVTDFNTEAGWATNVRSTVKLADFATIAAATSYSTFGFGNLQSRISERNREEAFAYDMQANVNLEKLGPDRIGMRIPAFASYEQSIQTPFFDPRDPDIPLEATLQSFDTEGERSEYTRIVQDRTTRRNINFTNVRKEKLNPDANRHIWDIENWSFTYAYSDIVSSNFNTAQYQNIQQRMGLNYNYSFGAVNFTPFDKIKFLGSDWLALIRDFNFSPLPSQMSFGAELNRRFIRTQLRNADLTTEGIRPNLERLFTFNRNYDLRWNLTDNLALDYTARVNTIIDEPNQGPDEFPGGRSAYNQVLWNNIADLGRMTNYNQQATATYKLPFDKIPALNWVQADARYGVSYTWVAGSLEQQDTLGNIIDNSQTQNLTGKVAFVELYNKIGWLESINNPSKGQRRPTGGGRTLPGLQGGQNEEEDEEEAQRDLKALKGVVRVLMSLRDANFTYTRTQGTSLPGYLPTPGLLGFDPSWNSPGYAFLLGSQDPDVRFDLAEQGFVATSGYLTTPFRQSDSETLDLRANLEPFKDFRIQVDFNKSTTGTYTESFRFFDPDNPLPGEENIEIDQAGFQSLSPNRGGSYSISYLPIRTTFGDLNADNTSEAFRLFEEYRDIIAERQASENGIVYNAENLNSQDVLIPAFLAAYSGQSVDEVSLRPFPRIPFPNWRVDYAGLSKIDWLAEYFSQVNINHAYTSAYTVSNFSSSLLYNPLQDVDVALALNNPIEDYALPSLDTEGVPLSSPLAGTPAPVYVISQVTITEQFAPFVGINLRTVNNWTIRTDYRRQRNLALNLSNGQVTEQRNNDITLNLGYVTDVFTLPFKVKGRTRSLNNDIGLQVAFTVRDTRTIQRQIGDAPTVTNGNINFQLRPSVDYTISQRVNLQFYVDRSINEPLLSNTFRRSSTAVGVQLRFNLAN